jgi:hypothetical protein
MASFTIYTPASLGIVASPTSRYLRNVIYSGAGLTFQAQKLYKPIPTDITDLIVTVLSGEACRLDLISYRIYTVPDLWWVIALMNNIRNPFTSPGVGQQLRCATTVRVYQSILGKV